MLIASRDQMGAENDRLRETLQTTKDLLLRSDQAMKAAQVELQNAETRTKGWKPKLTRLYRNTNAI